MSEDRAARVDEPAVLVQVTPSNYRSQAVGFIGGGLLLTALSIVLDVVYDRSFINPLLTLGAVGYGTYCATQAWRQATHTVLRIDQDGLSTGDGLHDHGWAGVVMVWVGSSTGLRLPLVSRPMIHVFTGAGMEFAQRVGTRPQARYTIPVAGRWRIADLCERLRKVTEASIVDGTRVSRRAAAASLMQDHRR